MSNETYTFAELDEMLGAFLYLGGVHASLGLVLDATHFRRDLALIELLNHAPVRIVEELLVPTVEVIDEAYRRLDGVRGAVVSALETHQALKDQPEADPAIAEAFDSIMGKLFGDQADKDGLT